MNTDDYMELAMRTENKDYHGIAARTQSKQVVRLLHGAMGLCDEAGEIQNAIKAHIFYGKPLDLDSIMRDVGDTFWFCALILHEIGFSIEQTMEANIVKLQARFPDAFTEYDAINRDSDKEHNAIAESNNGQ